MVDQCADEVFAAINNVRGGWSGEIEGDSDELGAEFTYRYKDMHRTKQNITELIPGKKTGWRVLESDLSFLNDKNEWTGTEIVSDVSAKRSKTEVRFTHAGLEPQIEYYGSCSNALGMLVNGNFAQADHHGKKSAGGVRT
jgi:hypothetical protein